MLIVCNLNIQPGRRFPVTVFEDLQKRGLAKFDSAPFISAAVALAFSGTEMATFHMHRLPTRGKFMFPN